MKKQLFLGLLAFISTAGTLMAQDNMQPKKPHERAKETYFKLKTDLALTGEQDAKVYQAFEDYYTTMQKLREEMRASGNTGSERMKDNVEKISTVRDNKLKAALTEEQMKKWVNEIEPGMRPQR